MALALAEAEAAAARGEVPVGAVLIDGEGRVLAAAGNRVEADRDPRRMPRCWCCVRVRPSSAQSA